jgi:hypothetical protein
VPEPFIRGLTRRGPDHLGARHVHVHGCGDSCGRGRACRLLLAASLMQLRGACRVRPPLSAPSGSVLCFNGELFGGLEVPPCANDGQQLLSALEASATAGEGGG